MQYLQTHQVTPMLNAAVNELAKAAPAEPYSFLINSLLKAAAAKGVETAFEQRMKSIQATLEQEQVTQHCDVLFGVGKAGALPDEVVDVIKQKLRKPQRTES